MSGKQEKEKAYKNKSDVTRCILKKIYELLFRVGRFSFFKILKLVLVLAVVHFSAEPSLVQGHLIFWCNNLCEWVVKKFDFVYFPICGRRTLEKNQRSGKCVEVIYEAD